MGSEMCIRDRLVAIPNKSAETCARALFERWICRFGVPAVLVSDRGREFLNETVNQMTEYLGVTHKFTSAFHPQTNASAERYNRTMQAYLTKMLDNDETLDWEQWLPAMMLSYNTQVHRATMESPFFLTYLHDPRLPYFDMDKPKPMYNNDFTTEAITRLGFSYRLAKENMEEATKLREAYTDKKTKERQFAVGDRCLVHFPNVKVGQNQKFSSRWKGIYTVVAIVGPVNLKLRLTPTSKPILVHVNRVKHLTEQERQSWHDTKRREPTTSPSPTRDPEASPPRTPERNKRPRPAPRPPRRKKDKTKPRNGRARKHLVVYVDSSSSAPDSSEDEDEAQQDWAQLPAPHGPSTDPLPGTSARAAAPRTPPRIVAGGDEQSSSEEELFFTPQRADRASSSPDFHGFPAPAEFQRESTRAEKEAFDQVTGRVTRQRAAKEDINVPTHQRCAGHGQSSKKK